MTLLFDSHALFWFLEGDTRLSRRVRTSIEDGHDTAMASAVSAWEIANKVRLGKWPEATVLANDFVSALAGQGIGILPITVEHAQLAGLMPGTHRDPFDRMLAAQSQIEQMPLVTADPALKTFGIRTIW